MLLYVQEVGSLIYVCFIYIYIYSSELTQVFAALSLSCWSPIKVLIEVDGPNFRELVSELTVTVNLSTFRERVLELALVATVNLSTFIVSYTHKRMHARTHAPTHTHTHTHTHTYILSLQT